MNRDEVTRRKAERKLRRRNKRKVSVARKINKMASNIIVDNMILAQALQQANEKIKQLEGEKTDVQLPESN